MAVEELKVGVLTAPIGAARWCFSSSLMPRVIGEMGQYVTMLVPFGTPIPTPREGMKTTAVVPSWSPILNNYDGVIGWLKENHADVLHIAVPFSKLDLQCFFDALAPIRKGGLRVIATLMKGELQDQLYRTGLRLCDAVVVRNEVEMRAAVSYGLDATKMLCIPEPALSLTRRSDARTLLGVEEGEMVVVGFVPSAANEEVKEIIKAVESISAEGKEVRAVLVRTDPTVYLNGKDYLRNSTTGYMSGYDSPVIQPVDLPFQIALPHVLGAADAVAFVSGRPTDEMSCALAAALAAGLPVVAPAESLFAEVSGSVLTYDCELPLAQGVRAVLVEKGCREMMKGEARANTGDPRFLDRLMDMYVAMSESDRGDMGEMNALGMPAKNSNIVPKMDAAAVGSGIGERPKGRNQKSTVKSNTPKVLMRLRDNFYSHRGGDTIQLEQQAAGLRNLGIQVDIDVTGKCSMKDYDLVHLANFALRESTQSYAEQCVAAGVPYVVSTFYEDWPKFFTRMSSYFLAGKSYVTSGQPKGKWRELANAVEGMPPAEMWDNSWTANRAAALICSGDGEASVLRKDYPATRSVEVCKLGSDHIARGDGGAMFRAETGLSDFILCVGRFEWRKNQLLLLKAMEESDLPIVFLGGGVTYQPEYLEICRAFRRKGKTVFMDRISPEMLSSAYGAARIHALPSWYELPGLVSLESALAGRNCVGSELGTLRDYLGDLAYYCDPGNVEDIYNAVMGAYYAPVREDLSRCAASYTWSESAAKLLKIYQQVLRNRTDIEWPEQAMPIIESVMPQFVVPEPPMVEPSMVEERIPEQPIIEPSMMMRDNGLTAKSGISAGIQVLREISKEEEMEQANQLLVEESLEAASLRAVEATLTVERIPNLMEPRNTLKAPDGEEEAKRLCDEGDQFVRRGALERGEELFARAKMLAPNFARAPRSLGVVALQRGQQEVAMGHFSEALRIDADDAKSMLGLGSIEWEKGNREQAFDRYLRAAEIKPDEPTAILFLVHSAYAINRLSDLEKALRRFLRECPDNTEMMYCLAGCYYKLNQPSRALGVLDRILRLHPEQEAALELKQKIEEEAGIMSGIDVTPKKEMNQFMANEPESNRPAATVPGLSVPTMQQTVVIEDQPLTVAQSTFARATGARTSQSPTVPVAAPIGVAPNFTAIETAKKKGSYEDAIIACDLILRDGALSETNRAQTLVLKGECLACSGKFDDAVGCFKAAESEPMWRVRALVGLGAVCAAGERYDEAAERFKQALAIRPLCDSALAGLGLCAQQKGMKDEAWNYYERALVMNPANMRALCGIVGFSYELKRLPRAAQLLELYLIENPDDHSIRYSYAGCMYAQGFIEKAMVQLTRILDAEPAHMMALELVERIQSESTMANAV